MKKSLFLLLLFICSTMTARDLNCMTLNGLNLGSTITIDTVIDTFGKPDTIDLTINRGRTTYDPSLISHFSFGMDDFNEFLLLAEPRDMFEYLIRFWYGESFVEIYTPVIPGRKRCFEDRYVMWSFYATDANWILSDGSVKVVPGNSFRQLKKISNEGKVSLMAGNIYYFFPLGPEDRNVWIATSDGKAINSLMFTAYLDNSGDSLPDDIKAITL